MHFIFVSDSFSTIRLAYGYIDCIVHITTLSKTHLSLPNAIDTGKTWYVSLGKDRKENENWMRMRRDERDFWIHFALCMLFYHLPMCSTCGWYSMLCHAFCMHNNENIVSVNDVELSRIADSKANNIYVWYSMKIVFSRVIAYKLLQFYTLNFRII